MRKVMDKYADLPNIFRRPLWRLWHRLLIRYDKEKSESFLNYGYHPLDESLMPILLPADENDRYCIQLYDHVAGGTDIKGKDVLEVGSGRGGGAYYLTRYKEPKSYTAMDISSSAINYCRKAYSLNNLSFVAGPAESLPFNDSSFDVVVNIESARCYQDIRKFYTEVARVLRPGGFFLYADDCWKGNMDENIAWLKSSGFEITRQENISQNVSNALHKDTARRKGVIQRRIPSWLLGTFHEFAAVEGSARYNSFKDGSMEYWCFALRKL